MTNRDDMMRHRGKEVMIINGHYKGWRGYLVDLGRNTCRVSRNGGNVSEFDKNDVVLR